MTEEELKILPTNMAVDIGDLRVNFLGNAEFLSVKDAGESPLHIHAVHEFQYVYSGVLHEVIDEERMLDVQEKYVLFIPPNILHRNSAGTCRRLAMAITMQQIDTGTEYDDFSEFAYYCGLMGKVREPVIFRDAEILECAEQLVVLADTNQNIHKKKLLLARLFVRLAECINLLNAMPEQSCSIQRGGIDDRQYYLIEQYINTKYAQKTSADEIAELLHVSRRQADRIVKRIFGKTYAALIQERRMSIAQTMIQKTDMCCTKIAEKIGYCTYTGFYVAFKEYFKCTPEEMRHSEEKQSFK